MASRRRFASISAARYVCSKRRCQARDAGAGAAAFNCAHDQHPGDRASRHESSSTLNWPAPAIRHHCERDFRSRKAEGV